MVYQTSRHEEAGTARQRRSAKHRQEHAQAALRRPSSSCSGSIKHRLKALFGSTDDDVRAMQFPKNHYLHSAGKSFRVHLCEKSYCSIPQTDTAHLAVHGVAVAVQATAAATISKQWYNCVVVDNRSSVKLIHKKIVPNIKCILSSSGDSNYQLHQYLPLQALSIEDS